MVPLNYHHLYYFYVIAKLGSITKACEKLLLSQPAVSTQLKQLERSLGKPLFDRRKQRLYLTETGRLVLDYAESIFELGQELADSLKNNSRPGRPIIRAGILSGAPRAFGHAMLECILTRFPEAHISVREGQLKELALEVREQKLDVLLTDAIIHNRDREDLSNHLIGKVPIVFAAAPALARRHPSIPHDLNGAPFILPTRPSDLNQKILDLLTEWKVAPKIIAEVQDAELARHLAVSGRGITPLNAFTVATNMPRKSLAVLKTKPATNLSVSVYLASRQRKWPNLLIDHLIKNFRLPTKPIYV